jgi:hypothetical protein
MIEAALLDLPQKHGDSKPLALRLPLKEYPPAQRHITPCTRMLCLAVCKEARAV